MKFNFPSIDTILKMAYHQRINFPIEWYTQVPKKGRTNKDPSPFYYRAADDLIKTHSNGVRKWYDKDILAFSGKWSLQQLEILKRVSVDIPENQINVIDKKFWLDLDDPSWRFYIKYDNNRGAPTLCSSVKHGSFYHIKQPIEMKELAKIEWEVA